MHESKTEETPKMKKTTVWLAAFCACALLLSVVAVSAIPQAPANVSGTWTITMAPMAPPAGGGGGGNGGGGGQGRGPGGPQTITFKQDGAKLIGTMAGRGGDISFEGTVTGNSATWTVKRPGRGDGAPDIITIYKADVNGDDMKGTAVTGDRPPRDFTATRGK
jgi:hypothetical protein